MYTAETRQHRQIPKCEHCDHRKFLQSDECKCRKHKVSRHCKQQPKIMTDTEYMQNSPFLAFVPFHYKS